MATSNCSDEFKWDAVHQATLRGYPVHEVSRRLGSDLPFAASAFKDERADEV